MRYPKLGLALALAGLTAGCGGRGDLDAGIPPGAFNQPKPPMSEAHLKMKEIMAKQGGRPAPVAKRPASAPGGSYYVPGQ